MQINVALKVASSTARGDTIQPTCTLRSRQTSLLRRVPRTAGKPRTGQVQSDKASSNQFEIDGRGDWRGGGGYTPVK
jgi:hypothetical protein